MEREQVKTIDGVICLSTAAMAEAFGVSQQALSGWKKRGCPAAAYGWWPLKDVIAWRGLDSKGADVSEAAQERESKRKLRALQAEALQLKNSIAAGEYVKRSEVQAVIGRFLAEHKRDLQAFEVKITSLVAPFVDQATMRQVGSDYARLVRDFLRRVAEGTGYGESTGRSRKK
jgi:phage terminase Nu1 subunit (DNA packaging protein)